MSHPLFGPEIRRMLEDQDADALKAFCESLHPATVAEAVDDEFTPEQVWEVISHANIRTQASIFEYLPPARQAEMAERARPQVGQLLGKRSPTDRVGLLRRLPPRGAGARIRWGDGAARRDVHRAGRYG